MSAQKPQARGVLGAAGAFIGMSVVAGLLVTAAVTPAIAVTGMAANNSIGVFEGLPEYLNVDQLAQPTTVYAKNGDLLLPEPAPGGVQPDLAGGEGCGDRG